MKRNKRLTLFILGIIIYIGIAILIFSNTDFDHYSTWGELLSGICSPVSAIGTLILSYFIYDFSSKEKQLDNDFRKTIDLYHKISESYEMLKNERCVEVSCNIKNAARISYYERMIKVDSILMMNYVRRFSSSKSNTHNISKTLLGIYVNPNNESDYIKLSEEIQALCYELNPDWDTTCFKIEPYE